MTPKELEAKFRDCKISLGLRPAIRHASELIYRSKEIYEEFSPFPWWVVGCIHFRESSLRWDRHLHNGDPLSARTIHYPPNRPAIGMPPFTWWDSAKDALHDRKLPAERYLGDWLDWLERYNGLGYRRRELPSPYLWSTTDVYKSGLYTSDGKFDSQKIDPRPGCAALLKYLEQDQNLCLT